MVDILALGIGYYFVPGAFLAFSVIIGNFLSRDPAPGPQLTLTLFICFFVWWFVIGCLVWAAVQDGDPN